MNTRWLLCIVLFCLLSTTGCIKRLEEEIPSHPEDSSAASISATESPLSSQQEDESSLSAQSSDQGSPAELSGAEEAVSGAPAESSAIQEDAPGSSQIQPPEDKPAPEDEPIASLPESSRLPVKPDSLHIQEELLLLINDERAAAGLEPLTVEVRIQFAAETRAEEILGSLSHTRPNGTPYHTVFDEAGFPYAGHWHGENLALVRLSEGSERMVAEALLTEWKKSPGHEQNLLSENFMQTGIGVHVRQQDDGFEIGAAQLFASL